jgi:putative membrane protein
MMYYGNGMGGWAMVLMTAGNLLFWGLVIAGVVLLVRNLGRGGQASPPTGQGAAPQQILAERFALGQINEEEYRQRLQVLDSTAGGRSTPGR